MNFKIGRYLLDINIDENKKYYDKQKNISKDCKCDACENYEVNISNLSQKVKDFFDEIGLQIEKPREVYTCYSENNILTYDGFYHVSGKIIKIEESSNTDDDISIDYNYKISFDEKCDLVSEDFPKPLFQMDIKAYLPWLLDSENIYE